MKTSYIERYPLTPHAEWALWRMENPEDPIQAPNPPRHHYTLQDLCMISQVGCSLRGEHSLSLAFHILDLNTDYPRSSIEEIFQTAVRYKMLVITPLLAMAIAEYLERTNYRSLVMFKMLFHVEGLDKYELYRDICQYVITHPRDQEEILQVFENALNGQ